MRLKDKTALITGGAAGIGRSICEVFLAEGARLVFTDLDSEQGAEVQRALGDGALFLQQDVSDEESWVRVLARTEQEFGKLDVLVNNAGIGSRNSNPAGASLEEWHKVLSVNLDGSFLGCKHALRLLRQPGGAIVNVSSVASSVPTPGDLAYGASKAGLWQLTRSLAFHCAKNGSGIRVNSVHPGAVLTEGIQQRRPQEVLDQVSQGIPLGHLGAPEDIAHAVTFLASDQARFITGQDLVIDGGFTLSPTPAEAPALDTTTGSQDHE